MREPKVHTEKLTDLPVQPITSQRPVHHYVDPQWSIVGYISILLDHPNMFGVWYHNVGAPPRSHHWAQITALVPCSHGFPELPCKVLVESSAFVHHVFVQQGSTATDLGTWE